MTEAAADVFFAYDAIDINEEGTRRACRRTRNG